MCVDEIHKFKNITQGKQANNLLDLINDPKYQRKSQHLALLSGTPVPNKLGDILMLLKLLYPTDSNIQSATIRHLLDSSQFDIASLIQSKMSSQHIADSLNIPEVTIQDLVLSLSHTERLVYEMILDQDMFPMDKMRLLDRLLLNPYSLGIHTQGSKMGLITHTITKRQKEGKKKIVIFVNKNVSDIVTGDKSMTSQMQSAFPTISINALS